MKVRISVTAKDIEHGWVDCSEACPVALAICRMLSSEVEVHVYPFEVSLLVGERARRLRLPESIRRWIARFDANGFSAVSPTSFELDIPKRYLRKAK